jgi:hypothetical protein
MPIVVRKKLVVPLSIMNSSAKSCLKLLFLSLCYLGNWISIFGCPMHPTIGRKFHKFVGKHNITNDPKLGGLVLEVFL